LRQPVDRAWACCPAVLPRGHARIAGPGRSRRASGPIPSCRWRSRSGACRCLARHARSHIKFEAQRATADRAACNDVTAGTDACASGETLAPSSPSRFDTGTPHSLAHHFAVTSGAWWGHDRHVVADDRPGGFHRHHAHRMTVLRVGDSSVTPITCTASVRVAPPVVNQFGPIDHGSSPTGGFWCGCWSRRPRPHRAPSSRSRADFAVQPRVSQRPFFRAWLIPVLSSSCRCPGIA